MNWVQFLELVFVGAGTLAHLQFVLARSSSAKIIWFNPILYAWSLCWTIWYASVFSSLNLETIGYSRLPYITAFFDILRGTILNLQVGLGLHGLSQMTGSLKKVPIWVWYAAPVGLVLWGVARIASHPMDPFLVNVEPVTRLFIAMDMVAGLVAIWMLTQGLATFDETRKGIARPLRKALVAMIPLLAGVLAIKMVWGFQAHGRYQWVLLFDLTHLLPPFAILWATYWTEAVALEVTLASWRRVQWFLGVFCSYMACKFAWPMSELDRLATWGASGLGLAGSMGPLSINFFRAITQFLNLDKQQESALLLRLEKRLRHTRLPNPSLPRFLARCIGWILDCHWQILPLNHPQVESILHSRGLVLSPEQSPQLIAMHTTTSRAEVENWATLEARWILPVASRDSSWAILLGTSSRMEKFPVEIIARLESLQATCQQVLLSREDLKRSLEAHRRLEEGERLAMLGLLAASAAHEIKNPLSAIRNVAMAARRDAPFGSVLDRDLEVVVGEVDRLDATVRRMLHFARDQSVCVDAPETLRVVVGLLALEAREKRLRLELSTPAEKIPLPISENDLKAILFNLILNALHHAPQGSIVNVLFDPATKAITVSNEGEIPHEFRPRLFQPLASLGGNGLGLYISRSKAEESGGHLDYVPLPKRTSFQLTWEHP